MDLPTVAVQDGQQRHHDGDDQDEEDRATALAVRLQEEADEIDQPEQQYQDRRPVAGEHRDELQKRAGDDDEHGHANAFGSGSGRELEIRNCAANKAQERG